MSAMTDEQRIWEFVQEVLDTNKLPEEVCVDSPELLWEVQKRWKQARRIDSQIEALFPSTDSGSPQAATQERQFLVDGQRPTIPGYEVDAVLGHGGMGVVYKARHVKLNRPVALKMMLYGAVATYSEQARFQREVEAVAALHHPHIVPIYDVGEADGRPYYTMEFLEGGSLAKRLAGTPQPAAAAAAYSLTLAEAVQAAHNAGIVHRDLKPSNILLTTDGALKISDFGLARRLDIDQSLTLTAANMGTPSYMAPEQALGKANAFSPAVDIYALGVMFYEMLTGRPPFRAETAAETQRQLIAEEPVPPSRLNASVPRDLETICLKCLEKEPERRYVSAGAVADDLKRFAEGRPIQARPVGWTERAWRWGRRNPTAAALLLTALALVAIVSGGWTWFVQQQSRRNAELRNEIGTDVTEAVSLRRGLHFREAGELLDQARQRVGPAGPVDLRRLVDQGQTELYLAERLDAARIQAATLAGRTTSLAVAEPLYESAFADAGLGRMGDKIEVVSARIRDSALSAELVTALDDWASFATDRQRREWLLTVARGADRNEARNRLRQPELWNDAKLWKDPKKLKQLAEDLKAAEYSPQLATALSRMSDGDASVGLLTKAQSRYPQDFWLNIELSATLSESGRWDEALGYCRAALAIRPDVSAAHNGLGLALYSTGRRDEGIGQLEQAVSIDANSVSAHVNLGRIDYYEGRLDESIDHLQQALRIAPKSAGIHIDLGASLAAKGRLDDAIGHFQQALSIDPKSAAAHYEFGIALLENGRLEESINQFQQALRISPDSDGARGNLGGALYAAARAAIKAAADKSSENERLGEPERAAKRRQALAWLRADLELTSKLLRDGKVLTPPVANWQTDSTLASVRDPEALAKLPAAQREQWQQLWADVAAIANDPLAQARGNAVRGEWSRAADGYARCLKRGSTDDGHFWFEYAAVSLLAVDRRSYDNGCEHMIKACGKVGGPRPYHVARACTLASDAAGGAELPIDLIENELQGTAQQFWSLTERAALAYRAGQFQAAAGFAEQSLHADPKPGRALVNWLWLALANHRLGKPEEARRWLGKAQKWLDQFGDGMPPRAEEELGLHLHNWLEAQILRREAEALVVPN
jgi:tetratricopeptide (TPR) repeat protein/tRNA A-37 threonylcarbamoyl transferase component Bud32